MGGLWSGWRCVTGVFCLMSWGCMASVLFVRPVLARSVCAVLLMQNLSLFPGMGVAGGVGENGECDAEKGAETDHGGG